MTEARDDYAENGIQAYEAIRPVFCTRELELQTIQVAMETDNLANTLAVLAADREYEANKAVKALTSAINPIMMLIVGAIVGVLVLAIYGPIVSISTSIG